MFYRFNLLERLGKIVLKNQYEMESLVISPMHIEDKYNSNYNCRITFNENEESKYSFYSTGHFFTGHDGFTNSNYYEYIQTTKIICDYLRHKTRENKSLKERRNSLNIIVYNKEYKEITYEDEEAALWDLMRIKFEDDFQNLFEKRGGLKYKDYSNKIETALTNIRHVKYGIDSQVDRLQKVIDFDWKCNNAFDKLIIGKIRNNYSLNIKEQNRFNEFKDSYIEAEKIKAFTRKGNKLITV